MRKWDEELPKFMPVAVSHENPLTAELQVRPVQRERSPHLEVPIQERKEGGGGQMPTSAPRQTQRWARKKEGHPLLPLTSAYQSLEHSALKNSAESMKMKSPHLEAGATPLHNHVTEVNHTAQIFNRIWGRLSQFMLCKSTAYFGMRSDKKAKTQQHQQRICKRWHTTMNLQKKPAGCPKGNSRQSRVKANVA